ncbi:MULTISPECIES: helix-turn-helix transcriptional regulator [Sphingobacterium]|uniref:helix-turn-helix transcriptional regulator n=1 Tax=Sphingobacterium TaxID=28453 RepID=UPI0010F00B8D|nr:MULTISPECIES: helix-turn-helix transcriptional regulator [Sphingobacterium]MCW2260165.1 ATP/maltotriose-dependent transcriptional regulator MalT [Sphingobacterium kitahiroshimense]TCR11044.1 regulatory LuxR family protein [Sphingobacterium sp. JUb78]
MFFFKKYLLFIIISLYFTQLYSQNIDHKSLELEISNFNDKNQNEKSIVKLDKIINDTKSTDYDRYHAYLQKSLTYKNLYNYTGALTNLTLAEKAGRNTKYNKETSTRVLIEQLFIYFDLKKNKEFNELLLQVKPENLKYIKNETRAFYECILGNLEMKKGNYVLADKYFDNCIILLKKENPKHLPIIYKVKVELYNLMGKHKEAIKAFEIGMDYAEKFQIDIYKITMLETIIYYYTSNEQYKEAYLAQSEVTRQRKLYDAANRSGQLNNLEKELLQQRSDIELNNKKNMQLVLSTIIILLCILIFVLFKLFQSNKQRRLLIEKEIARMRIQLESYINHTAENKNDQLYLNLEKYNLKPRHLEIIELIRKGKTNKEIGNELFISENTVKYHLKIIYEILDIDNRSELTK